MSDANIRVENLRKSFGNEVAVDDVSFTVAAGSVVGLLGPNGAGKTTVVNCLSTLHRPDSGTMSILGHDVVSEGPKVRELIAVTGQFTAVDEMLTGMENLVLFGRLLRLGRVAARARADELVQRLDLAENAGKATSTYSGGTRRRLDLALSLVVPRPVLFLDEPTTGLDPRSRYALWDVVRELSAEGTSVLLTTQYLEEADRLADTILLLDKGRFVAEGSPAELKGRIGGAVCQVRVSDPLRREAAQAALSAKFSAVTVLDEVLTLPADGASTVAEVIAVLESESVEIAEVGLRGATLDEVFLTLTGPVEAA
jgi:ABC-2 type transport system ATP-binding protein